MPALTLQKGNITMGKRNGTKTGLALLAELYPVETTAYTAGILEA